MAVGGAAVSSKPRPEDDNAASRTGSASSGSGSASFRTGASSTAPFTDTELGGGMSFDERMQQKGEEMKDKRIGLEQALEKCPMLSKQVGP